MDKFVTRHSELWKTVNQGGKSPSVCCTILSAFVCLKVFLMLAKNFAQGLGCVMVLVTLFFEAFLYF